MHSPIVAAALLADGVVDAQDQAALASAVRTWRGRGSLQAALGLPANGGAWQRQRRDLLLAVLALLVARVGDGPATVAGRVSRRLQRGAPGVALDDADRLVRRIVETGTRIPRARQIYNIIRTPSAISNAEHYIDAVGFRVASRQWVDTFSD